MTIYKRDRETANGKSTRSIIEVADYTTGGRRFRSFSDIAEARKEAEKIARQLSSGEATAPMMRNNEAASYGRSVELIRPIGASLEVASAVYAKCYEILGRDAMIEDCQFYKRHGADQIQTKRVPDVATELIASREKRTMNGRPASPRYIGDLKSGLTRFGAAFVVDISAITKADVQHYLDGLAAPRGPSKTFARC